MIPPVNVKEYETLARQKLSHEAYEYYASGAADEITLRENEEAWARLRVCPRILVDVAACDLRASILGWSVAMPVMTAPCGLNAMAHPDGELGVARATAAAGVIQVLSMASAFSMEEVAATAPGPRWFQMYCMRDRGISRAMAERAEAAGYSALCLTVDAPFDGLRERERRANIQYDVSPPAVRNANFMPYMKGGTRATSGVEFFYDASLTWAGLDWLRGNTRLPLVLKGIQSAEDARLAVRHGVRGIVVSNHGGRELDTVMTTCAALPRVADAVAGEAEVFVDGGIRRGTDILKALALGARAVLVGRPYLWGLAVGGESGVRRILEMLREELRVSMALAGCPRISDIGRRLIA